MNQKPSNLFYKMVSFVFCFSMSISPISVLGQNDSDLKNEWKEIINIDTVTISVSKTSFDIESFIRLVIADKSLYNSFKNLRLIEYKAFHDIKALDKSNKTKDFFHSESLQLYNYGCRKNICLYNTYSPNYFKNNGDHKYLTSKIYQHVFLDEREICENSKDTKVSAGLDLRANYIERIKMMVFSPTSANFIPLIGNKNMIFTKKNRKKYDFELRKIYKYGFDTYELEIKRKNSVPEEDVMIERIVTHFNIVDLQIVHREMNIKYDTKLLDLNVHFDIKTKMVKGNYYPEEINYQGNWDVPFKKRESISFQTRFFF